MPSVQGTSLFGCVVRTTSVNGMRFVSLEEGRARWDSTRRLYFPYKDQIGKWTIGVGHLIEGQYEKYKTGITDANVDALLALDLHKCDEALATIKWPRPRTQNEHDALASWLINVGTGWATNRINGVPKSLVVRRIESREFEQVPAALALYDVADGKHVEYLKARRIREGKLFALPDGANQAEVQRLALLAAELKYAAEHAHSLLFDRLQLLHEDDLG